VGVWGQQKYLKPYNHRIQAINENGYAYNTQYQYYIKILNSLNIHRQAVTQSAKHQLPVQNSWPDLFWYSNNVNRC